MTDSTDRALEYLNHELDRAENERDALKAAALDLMEAMARGASLLGFVQPRSFERELAALRSVVARCPSDE